MVGLVAHSCHQISTTKDHCCYLSNILRGRGNKNCFMILLAGYERLRVISDATFTIKNTIAHVAFVCVKSCHCRVGFPVYQQNAVLISRSNVFWLFKCFSGTPFVLQTTADLVALSCFQVCYQFPLLVCFYLGSGYEDWSNPLRCWGGIPWSLGFGPSSLGTEDTHLKASAGWVPLGLEFKFRCFFTLVLTFIE